MTTADTIFASIRYTTFTATTTFQTYSAALQREMFGAPVFGKKSIRWNARRQMVETRVTTISRDYDVQSYTLSEIANLVNSQKYATKGYSSYYNKTAQRVCK